MTLGVRQHGRILGAENVAERKIVDIWEPKEEGLVTVRQERFLTILEVTLTKTPTAEQKKHAGYHVPLPGKF